MKLVKSTKLKWKCHVSCSFICSVKSNTVFIQRFKKKFRRKLIGCWLPTGVSNVTMSQAMSIYILTVFGAKDIVKNLRTLILIMKPLIFLFWTSGDVCLGSQSLGGPKTCKFPCLSVIAAILQIHFGCDTCSPPVSNPFNLRMYVFFNHSWIEPMQGCATQCALEPFEPLHLGHILSLNPMGAQPTIDQFSQKLREN